MVEWERKAKRVVTLCLLDNTSRTVFVSAAQTRRATAVIDHSTEAAPQRALNFRIFVPDGVRCQPMYFSYFMEAGSDHYASDWARVFVCIAIESDRPVLMERWFELEICALKPDVIAEHISVIRLRYVIFPQEFYIAYASARHNARALRQRDALAHRPEWNFRKSRRDADLCCGLSRRNGCVQAVV